MEGIIIGAMLVGFFAGGNLVIVLKDIEHKGKADNINIVGLIVGSLGILLLTLNVLSGVFNI